MIADAKTIHQRQNDVYIEKFPHEENFIFVG